MRLRPRAHVVHYTRGRLRIKIPAARGDAAFFGAMRGKLLGATGICDVRCNPATASLLIFHQDGIDPVALVGTLPDVALCADAAPAGTSGKPSGPSTPAPDVVGLVAKVLPLAFAGHPAGTLVDIVAEPVLRAAIAAVEPQWDWSWAIVTEPDHGRLPEAA